MRILILSTVFATPARPKVVGGAEVVAGLLADGLRRRGHEVAAIRSVRGGAVDESRGFSTLDGAAPNLYAWTPDGPRNLIARAAWHFVDDRGMPAGRARDLLDSFRPDVVACHSISGLGTGLWRAAARRSVPVVHTLHDYYLMCPRTTMRRGAANCERLCVECRIMTTRRRASARALDTIVSVSARVLARHEGAGVRAGGTRRCVIHNVVPTDALAAIVPVRVGRAPRFGYIGRGIAEKGLPLLLEAFADPSLRDAQLVIAGRMEPTVEAAIAAHPRRGSIHPVGFVGPADFYAQVDAVVVPSLWEEPFATVILEAQASGRAVIGTTRGGTPEAVGGEDFGWLFDPDEPGALATILRAIAADPGVLERRGAAARMRAEARSFEAYLDAYEHVYAAAANRRQ